MENQELLFEIKEELNKRMNPKQGYSFLKTNKKGDFIIKACT